jgi:hypothetical protein
MAIAYGCFAFCALMAFHSKKPSTGTMHRRRRYAFRNVARSPTVSHLALIGFRPPSRLLQHAGIKPHCKGVPTEPRPTVRDG